MELLDRGEPAYRALATILRTRIADGRYRGGVRLPTEFELADEFGLSRQTVRRAFQDLVAEGRVYRVPGRGTFVSENSGRYLRQLGSIEDLMSLSDDTTMEVLESPRRCVDVGAASRLRLDTDVLYRFGFRRGHGDVAFAHTAMWWPEPIARLLTDVPEVQAGATSTATAIGLLEPRMSSPIVEAAQSITVSKADDEVAAALDCAAGESLLRVDRLYSDADGRPVELAISHFLPEHYTYRVTLRRSSPY